MKHVVVDSGPRNLTRNADAKRSPKGGLSLISEFRFMRHLSARPVLLASTLYCGLLHAQSQTISLVASTYTITLPTGFTGAFFSTLELSISYPAGLSASSYVPYNRLNSDFQNLVRQKKSWEDSGSGSLPSEW
jgi:hypothetical protein